MTHVERGELIKKLVGRMGEGTYADFMALLNSYLEFEYSCIDSIHEQTDLFRTQGKIQALKVMKRGFQNAYELLGFRPVNV